MFREGTGFRIGDYYYAGLGEGVTFSGGILPNISFAKFSSITETWTSSQPFSTLFVKRPFSFVIKNKGFVGGGSNSQGNVSYDLYQFDPVAELWSFKSSFPTEVIQTSNGIGFSANGRGYVANPTSGTVYEYDPDVDTWINKSTIPGALPIIFKGQFTLDNKEYIVFARNTSSVIELWEYDHESNVWTRKADYPGLMSQGCYAMQIDGYGYAGALDHFWKYDRSVNSWTRLQPYPSNGATNLVAFSFGKNGYVGLAAIPFNFSYGGPINDLFVFQAP